MISYQFLWKLIVSIMEHTILRLLKEWRADLDQNKIIGALL